VDETLTDSGQFLSNRTPTKAPRSSNGKKNSRNNNNNRGKKRY